MKNFFKRLKAVPVIILLIAVFTILFSVFEKPILILLKQSSLHSFMNNPNPKTEDVQSVPQEGKVVEVTVVPVGDGEIDINNASAEMLDTLPEIGSVRAKAIVEQREKMNGFTTLEDIMCAEGIGEGLYKKILPYIKINPRQNY